MIGYNDATQQWEETTESDEISEAREEGRREAAAEIARLKEDRDLWKQSENDCAKANRELEEKLKIAIEGLEKAQIALSRFIDSAIPYYDHPLNKNKFLHENNPARVALEKIRNYPGIPEGSKGLSSPKELSKSTKFGIPQNANTQRQVPRIYGT